MKNKEINEHIELARQSGYNEACYLNEKKLKEIEEEIELWKDKALNEHKRYMETSKQFNTHEKRIKEIEKFHEKVIDFLKDKEYELLNRLEYNMDYKKSKQKVIIQANFLDKINKKIDKMYGRFK